ncbi:threonine ammonia-lyase, biosynthetic [Uliginosibacterium paludis]|uniref:L-threonine dehydratase n=1 Tax=Uliginosibacterium paludis TaxID=1615952 RepID=A0ABV2CTM2_9RHOO
MSQESSATDYLVRILDARVYEAAIETPLDAMPALSRRIGHQVWLKREDMQPVFSFKLRGAYNKMARLTPGQRARGVICASAGNHAQGVAMSAQKLGCRAVVVMPLATPSIKVDAVRARGGEVVLAGDSFDDAYARARELEAQQGLTFVHPFDDPDVIAGQGTIGVEILRQHAGQLDAVFCTVGGGGLLAGVSAYIKRIRPGTRLIGVEAVDSDAMAQSLARGERVALPQVGLFADGAAVKRVGEECFRLCREYVDEIILVNNDAICAAIKDVFEDTRSILEPAGALALAGAKAWLARQKGPRSVVAVASGANMNFDRLRFVAERAEVGEQREAVLAVSIPEQPGSFKAFCSLLGGRTITEFNYRLNEGNLAHVFVGLAISQRSETQALIAQLAEAGLPALDLSDDEMAKCHTRYMVGGRAPYAANERVYRFSFPERPDALLRFLEHLRSDWNISLFHYRNHGADFGRALVGMQVPPEDVTAFEAFLARVGYECVEETANPAYRLFLR